MPHLDEGRIHAWLDGALGEDDARAAEAHAAQCAECGRRVAAARGMIAAASRILTALDNVPAGVIPEGGRSDPTTPPSRWGRRYGRLAAVIGFITVSTLVVTRGLNRHETLTRATPASDALHVDTVARAGTPSQTVAPRAAVSPPRRRAEGRPVSAGTREAMKAATPMRTPTASTNGPTPSPAPLAAAGKAADAASAPAAAPPPALQARANTLALREVVVSSATSSAALPRLVSRDTVQRDGVAVDRAVYELRPDVRVVLVSTTPGKTLLDSSATTDASLRLEKKANGAVNEIQWRDAAGVDYVLFGPVSVEELQRVRRSLHH